MKENNNRLERKNFSDNNRDYNHVPRIIKKGQGNSYHKRRSGFKGGGSKSFKFGQIIGILYHFSFLYLIYYLVQNNQIDLAVRIFAINTFLIAFIFIIIKLEKLFFIKRKSSFSKDKNGGFQGRKIR